MKDHIIDLLKFGSVAFVVGALAMTAVLGNGLTTGDTGENTTRQILE